MPESPAAATRREGDSRLAILSPLNGQLHHRRGVHGVVQQFELGRLEVGKRHLQLGSAYNRVSLALFRKRKPHGQEGEQNEESNEASPKPPFGRSPLDWPLCLARLVTESHDQP